MDKIINPQAFEAFAVKTYKITAEDLASLYNEAGELTDFTLLSTKDAERITKLSGDSKNQYSRGLKEAALNLEKKVKEKYEVESDLIGEELIDFIIETKIGEVKTATPGDVMKLPEVIALINKHSKESKAKDKEWQDKFTAKEKDFERSNLFADVKKIGRVEFDKLRPILPKDPGRAQMQIDDLFYAKLNEYDYQKDGDIPIVLNKKDGTPLMDDHGHPVLFTELVKNITTKSFDLQAAEDRSSSGNSNQTNVTGSKVRKPKDYNDYTLMMKDNSLTSKDRTDIMHLAEEAKII
jgi:hypothetical protein